MENNSNTSNQKNKYDLKLFLDYSFDKNSNFFKKLESTVHIVEESSIANFTLQKKSFDYILTPVNTSPQRFFLSEENLFSSLKTLSLIRSSVNFDGVYKLYNRIQKHRSKQNDLKQYLLKLTNLLHSTSTLVSFMQEIFNFKSLHDFQTIHLFVHEKGQANSTHFEIERETHREYIHNISDFSNLFQSIRKSKNRTFGQNALKGFNFEILGTFLAHEFSLSNHNLILVISRNDFLPQTSEEIKNFHLLTKVLASFIEIKLDQKLIRSKVASLKSTIQCSPYKIFSNNELLTEFNQPLLDHNKKTYFNNEKHFFEISSIENSLIDHGDIYHHERVSLLGELLNTLRHELSNPIFGLQLSTELLLLEEHDEEQTSFLNEVLLSIKRSQSILESFTSLYKDTNSYEEVDLIQLINEVFTLTKSESRHLFKEVHSTENQILFNTNSTWLAQIIFNLVINSSQACKEIENAKLDIFITKTESTIIFKIQDNGPGISNSETSDIFKAFYTTKRKGTGLGLAICKSLATKLNGSIKYVHDDKGAQFLLELPYENISH